MTPSDRALESSLRALGPRVDFPETPALSVAVAERLPAPAPSARRSSAPSARRSSAPALALTTVALLAGFLVASPGAREAVADWFGIGGVRIVYQDPPLDARPEGGTLGLGERVSLTEAQGRVDFPLRLLAPAQLGLPDESYVALARGFEQVAFVYGPRQGIAPEVRDKTALLFTQFAGSFDGPFMKKLAVSSSVEPVEVDGAFGFWVEGEHVIRYEGPDGGLRTESSRLAASTLLWEVDGITYRLEGDLPKERALALAHTVR